MILIIRHTFSLSLHQSESKKMMARENLLVRKNPPSPPSPLPQWHTCGCIKGG